MKDEACAQKQKEWREELMEKKRTPPLVCVSLRMCHELL